MSAFSASVRPSVRRPVVSEDMAKITDSHLPWPELAGMSIWVTGATGMIPAYMVELFLYLNETVLDRPCRVTAMVRDMDKGRKRFAQYTGRTDLRIITVDLSKPGLPDVDHSEAPDYVIHGASQSGVWFYRTDPIGTLLPNVRGTEELIGRAHVGGRCRGFLFMSSGAVYGELEDSQKPVSEDRLGTLDPTDPAACYAMGKRMGEHLCACWSAQHGVRTISARLGHTYGPGMRLDDNRVYADFVKCILARRDIVLKSSGQAVRQFCYLSDAATALMMLMFRGKAGQSYNVVNPMGTTSIKALAYALQQEFSEYNLQVVHTNSPDRDGVLQEGGLMLSIDKITELGWAPRVSLGQGFRRTVRSFHVE